jgi:hypothetical protein
MTALLKNRWLWVGVIWALSAAVTFWNHQKVDFILSLQAQNQNLHNELMFQQQNSRKLERILEENSKLFLNTESIQLGVLSVKSAFSDLAARLELNILQMAVVPIAKGAETVSLNLSFSGSFEGVMSFLSALSAYRYLQDKQVAIKVDSKSGESSCELSLALRCRVQPRPGESKPPVNEPKVHSAL